MTVMLIIISLYQGIERVPMNSEESCRVAAEQFNIGSSRYAHAYCIKQ